MRSPPSHVDSGDSHASRSPPLKREDGGKKVNDETNTVLSYRNCNFSLCAVARSPQPAHISSRGATTHPVPHRPQLNGATTNLRANRLVSLELWVSVAVTPRPGSRT